MAAGCSCSSPNLAKNPSFEKVRNNVPEYWEESSPRDELAPETYADRKVFHTPSQSLCMNGEGKPYSLGKIHQVIEGISPEESYRFEVHFKTNGIRSIGRDIATELDWLDKDSKIVRTDPIHKLGTKDGWHLLEGAVRAHETAESVDVKLMASLWGGTIWWDDVHLSKAEYEPEPRRRKIKISTTRYRWKSLHENPKAVEENLDFADKVLDEAGANKSDVVCLTEIFNIGLGSPSELIGKIAESIPGPTTNRLSKKAKECGMYVVASLYEKDEESELIYNTAVLIDREGEIIGKYHKTHPTSGEIFESGVTPGNDYPVFQTDFGKVGMEICYDMFFPEVTRILALKGATFIFHPSAGVRYHPTRSDLQWFPTVRTRAMDNNVYIVSSMTSNSSVIVNPDGEILACSTLDGQGVFTAEAELPEQPRFHEINKRRQETYKALIE